MKLFENRQVYIIFLVAFIGILIAVPILNTLTSSQNLKELGEISFKITGEINLLGNATEKIDAVANALAQGVKTIIHNQGVIVQNDQIKNHNEEVIINNQKMFGIYGMPDNEGKNNFSTPNIRTDFQETRTNYWNFSNITTAQLN